MSEMNLSLSQTVLFLSLATTALGHSQLFQWSGPLSTRSRFTTVLNNLTAVLQVELISQLDMAAVAIPSSSSSYRRKPRFTYRSPSAADSPTQPYIINLPKNLSPPLPLPFSNNTQRAHDLLRATPPETLYKRNKYDTVPPLPLYHPFGKLALSLPPLDARAYNLPEPIQRVESSRSSSSRARRTSIKQRDDSLPSPPINEPSPTPPEPKPKEKSSPRKKAKGGGSSKRKRKDAEDADPSYPAKRTRLPRGVKDSPAAEVDASPPDLSSRVSATPELSADIPEDNKSGKRAARSRRPMKAPESSASGEETSTDVSLGANSNAIIDPVLLALNEDSSGRGMPKRESSTTTLPLSTRDDDELTEDARH